MAPVARTGRTSAAQFLRERLQSHPHNNKTADPVHGSAATSIAAAGMPPEPHERDAAIVARPLGSCAFGWRDTRYPATQDRTNFARGLKRARRAATASRGLPVCLTLSPTGRAWPRPSPIGAVRGRPRIETRVEESHRGEPPFPTTRKGLERANERDSGRLAARRTRLTDDDCPPRPWDSGPPARPYEGC